MKPFKPSLIVLKEIKCKPRTLDVELKVYRNIIDRLTKILPAINGPKVLKGKLT